jgi:hypothetical protein
MYKAFYSLASEPSKTFSVVLTNPPFGKKSSYTVLGADGKAERETQTFRRFQAQPAQRERPLERQLRRFMGTRSGRKIRYGGLMVDALDLDEMPRPLNGVLGVI